MKDETKKEILERMEKLINTSYIRIEVKHLLKDIKQLLSPEEKPDFVKGMIVKGYLDNSETQYDILNKIGDDGLYECAEHWYPEIEPLDFPTFARTIAYFIPEAEKAVLKKDNYFIFENENGCELTVKGYDGKNHIIRIPFPNPSGKRIEVSIEREEI